MNSRLKELFEERNLLINYTKKKNNVIEIIMDICSCLFTFEFPLFIGSVILYIADGLIRIKCPHYTNNAGLQGISSMLLIVFFVILFVIISGMIIDYVVNRKFYEERRKIVKYYSELAKKEKEKQYKKLDKIYKKVIKKS